MSRPMILAPDPGAQLSKLSGGPHLVHQQVFSSRLWGPHKSSILGHHEMQNFFLIAPTTARLPLDTIFSGHGFLDVIQSLQ